MLAIREQEKDKLEELNEQREKRGEPTNQNLVPPGSKGR